MNTYKTLPMKYKINDDTNTYIIINMMMALDDKYYQEKNGELLEVKRKEFVSCNDGGTRYISFEYDDKLHPDFKGVLKIPRHMSFWEKDDSLLGFKAEFASLNNKDLTSIVKKRIF